jgi:hypothetical protein
MYSNLSRALKYAEKKGTISRNRPRPHYQYPTNRQIHLEVPHQPAIIHPRNNVANNRGVRDIRNLRHYNPVDTRRQQLQHQQQLLQQQHQHLLQLLQLQEHHKEMTDKFCRYNGYTKYFLPAPKLIARASKAASNNNQKLGAIRESSASQRQRTSPKVSSKSPSATSATSRRNQKTNNPPSDTPRVLEGTKRVMRLSRSTNRRSIA